MKRHLYLQRVTKVCKWRKTLTSGDSRRNLHGRALYWSFKLSAGLKVSINLGRARKIMLLLKLKMFKQVKYLENKHKEKVHYNSDF